MNAAGQGGRKGRHCEFHNIDYANLILTVIACPYAIAAVPVAARLNHEIVMPCRNGAEPPVQSAGGAKTPAFWSFLARFAAD
jgi:hypothetical protein